MKRFVAVLGGLLLMPAFAEVAPVYYDEVIEYSDVENESEDVVETDVATVNTPVVPVSQTRTGGRATSTRASRALPNTSGSGVTTRSSSAPSRAVAARTTTNRTANISQVRNTTARGTASRASRAAANTVSQSVSARRATPVNTSRASIIQNDTVNTPLYTGRVGVRTRAPSVRAAGAVSAISTDVVAVDASDVTATMEELMQLTDFCKAQYTDCMDNFCNVLDDNQGRCSCSRNIKDYAKVEEALKKATEELQDVAQKIKYLSLSPEQIETLFTQTEAEEAMKGTTDNTQLKNDLDRIKNLIVDVKTGTASSSASSSTIGIDLSGLLNFSIDSNGFDLSALFGNTTNTSSISNQRGEDLYKTASARCRTNVLNNCQAQGVDISVVTNAYDLEIDKQCIAYERSLTESNEQMASTVRNAKAVLQEARLMVAKQKNTYGMLECVEQLDKCMQDDFVCGSDYENCLDPSGKYIVNGEIVVGSEPGTTDLDSEPESGLYETWNYDTDKNAWVDGGTVAEYISNKVTGQPQEVSTNMAEFLSYKIGYNEDGKNFGMCMSVLNQCQDYTYAGGEYQPNNRVVKEYLQRTLTQIKAAQDTIVANYAENCIRNVSSCLYQNGYDEDKSVSSSSKVNDIAINACRAVIKTCMSTNGETVTDNTAQKSWVEQMLGCGEGQEYNSKKGKCVQIKDCEEGQKYDSDTEKCVSICDEGEEYNITEKKCVPDCDEGEEYNSTEKKCMQIPDCEEGQEYDSDTGECVTTGSN